jgi:hypothetical protein
MAFNVNDIKQRLVTGGARPTLFEVNITNPINGGGNEITPFMVKAAQLPSSTLGVIEVPYFGRKIKVAGDRTFEEWTVTVINDEQFTIRSAMEDWMAAINTHEGNLRVGNATFEGYKNTDAEITQFAKDGSVLRVYSFKNIFPSVVAPIEMAWDSNDTIEEFTVTLQYDYWTVSGGVTAGGTGTTV